MSGPAPSWRWGWSPGAQGAPAFSRRDHQRALGLHSGARSLHRPLVREAEPRATWMQREPRGGTEEGPRSSTPHPAPPQALPSAPCRLSSLALTLPGTAPGDRRPSGDRRSPGLRSEKSHELSGPHEAAYPRGGGVPGGTAASGQLSPPLAMSTGGGPGRQRRSLRSQWNPDLGRFNEHRVEAVCVAPRGSSPMHGPLGHGNRQPGQASLSP